jgi:hypothetical protein
MPTPEAWTCPVCSRVLHPRSAYDRGQHEMRSVHLRAAAVLAKYRDMLAGVITPYAPYDSILTAQAKGADFPSPAP